MPSQAGWGWRNLGFSKDKPWGASEKQGRVRDAKMRLWILERKLGHAVGAERFGVAGEEPVMIGLCDRKASRIS